MFKNILKYLGVVALSVAIATPLATVAVQQFRVGPALGPIPIFEKTEDPYPTTVINPNGTISFGTGSAVATTRVTFGASQIDFADEIAFATGTAAAPSVTFTSDSDSGLFSAGANTLGISTNGTDSMWFVGSALIATPSGRFCFDASGVGEGLPNNCETEIIRETAGEIGVGTDGGGHAIIGTNIEELTDLSGATATSSELCPADTYVLGVTTYVDTAITGATSYSIGDGSDADRWGATIAVDVDTTSDLTDLVGQGPQLETSALDVVLTAAGSNFTAGDVTVSCIYLSIASGS